MTLTPKTFEELAGMSLAELQTYFNQLGTFRGRVTQEIQNVRDEVDSRMSDTRLRSFVAGLTAEEVDSLKVMLGERASTSRTQA